MPDELRRYQPPIIPEPTPEPDMLSFESFADTGQQEPQPPLVESKPRWQWIGSKRNVAAATSKDGISDLFRIDTGAEKEDIRDAVDVDIDRDIRDADPDGSYDSVTTVTPAQVMGDEEPEPELGSELDYELPQRPTRDRFYATGRRPRPGNGVIIRRREPPPMSMGGMRY